MLMRTAAMQTLAWVTAGMLVIPRPPCPTCAPAASTAGARKGVWVSIESPLTPFDNANQGVLLLVHTYWMHGAAAMSVEGRAEGTVNGERRTVPLTFQDRGDGVYALAKSWPDQGRWALVITARSRGQQASALVRLSADGKVAGVQVTPERAVADAEVAAALQ